MDHPGCAAPSQTLVLLAQTVQSATWLPCVAGMPDGWTYAGSDLRSGSATYWLSSAVLGSQAVEVQLLSSCRATGDPVPVEGNRDIAGYVSSDGSTQTRTFVFEGGCIVEQIALASTNDPSILDQAQGTLGFLDRTTLAATLERDYDVVLCGAGATPCIGG
jgi:hypothetical protein